MAEGILQSLVETHNLPWMVGSAAVSNYHIGAAPYSSAQKICQEHHIDIGQQRARLFSPADFSQYDLIYAMDSSVLTTIEQIAQQHNLKNTATLFLDELYPHENKSVTDPWYGPESGFEEVFIVLEQGCKAIIHNHAKLSL